MDPLLIILPIVGLIVGIIGGGALIYLLPLMKAKRASSSAEKILNDAETKVEKLLAEAKKEARENAESMRKIAEEEIKERKATVIESEKKLEQRESLIDRRDETLLSKEQSLEAKNERLNQKLAELNKKEADLQTKIDSIIVELQKVASMSVNDAKEEIMRRVEQKMSREISAYIKTKEEEAEDTAEDKAKDLLGFALSKYAQEVTTDRTVSVVALPSDEMKGRIIGREGRNIRSLENLLGVDILIDDTPEAITVSCFNPIRREIACQTLNNLIKDGRIQPGRIEEIAAKAKEDVELTIHKAGEAACFKLGITKISKEIVDTIGRLKYRTSYGQSVLEHSMQVAYLAGIMAAELGLDQNLARRAGLLHDLGKALDFEQEGSHVELGVKLAKKYGENDVVVNAIESHHGDVKQQYVISYLVQAADTLSAARPGARSETLENYIQRIEKLEELCKQYDGVSNCFAMQAGREVRVMVVPEKVNDDCAAKLAHDIKEKIETEMTYPGQIKVSVIREVRATEIAK